MADAPTKKRFTVQDHRDFSAAAEISAHWAHTEIVDQHGNRYRVREVAATRSASGQIVLHLDAELIRD